MIKTSTLLKVIGVLCIGAAFIMALPFFGPLAAGGLTALSATFGGAPFVSAGLAAGAKVCVSASAAIASITGKIGLTGIIGTMIGSVGTGVLAKGQSMQDQETIQNLRTQLNANGNAGSMIP